MTENNMQALIASRLEDMAAQCELLFKQGNYAEAQLIREEGLQLAAAYDQEDDFLVINDLSLI